MASSCESSPQPSALAPQSRILLAPPVDTTMEERAGSPMFVDEDEMEPQFSKKPGNTLAKTLVHIHSMISEAEQEAELGHRIPGHLSPLHENTELVTGSWSSAMRLRTFSSASSQSSSLTPCSSKSSLSPGSPGFLNSPHSSPVGPDTTEFQEFIYSSRKLLERDLSDLTLTDREQWELYEAAKIIQNAYRNYKVNSFTLPKPPPTHYHNPFAGWCFCLFCHCGAWSQAKVSLQSIWEWGSGGLGLGISNNTSFPTPSLTAATTTNVSLASLFVNSCSLKTRRHQQEQEIEAAILIQHHYRRYKEVIVLLRLCSPCTGPKPEQVWIARLLPGYTRELCILRRGRLKVRDFFSTK